MDRPLIASWVGSFHIPALYPSGLAQLPEGKLEPDAIRFKDFRPDYERLFQTHCQAAVDVPWAAFPVMVVPWLEAIVGCPIFHHGGHIWAEPWLDSYDQLQDRGISLNHNWLGKLVEFIRWLVTLSCGRFPVALSLMRGPADLLAAMRGAQRSIYDLFDHPEPVAHTLNALTDVWIQVAHAQQKEIPEFVAGYSFSVQNLWSRRPGAWFQDDAIAFWSPDLYRRFVRSCEARLATCMAVTGIHLHPASLFTVDDLIDMPNLQVIEVNLDDAGPRIPELLPRFRQIIEKKRLMIWGAFTREELRVLKEQLPTRGLSLQLMAETSAGIRALVRDVEEIWSD